MQRDLVVFHHITFTTASIASLFSPKPFGGMTCSRNKCQKLVMPYIESEIAMGLNVGIDHNEKHTDMGLWKNGCVIDKHSNFAQTLYEIGSITKTFTCILLADAIQKERSSSTNQ